MHSSAEPHAEGPGRSYIILSKTIGGSPCIILSFFPRDVLGLTLYSRHLAIHTHSPLHNRGHLGLGTCFKKGATCLTIPRPVRHTLTHHCASAATKLVDRRTQYQDGSTKY